MTRNTLSPLPLPVPERGFVSSQPASRWEEGLLCGNGTIGANALSWPLDERIVFTHERLFMPMGAPVMPPDNAARLPEIRRLIDRGLYAQACELQFRLSGQSHFMYPDFFVPAFDLTIRGDARGTVHDYARSVNFRTGEATVHWADDRGAYMRKLFVSRADGVAVVLLTAPATGMLDCRLALEPREPSEQFNGDSDIAQRSDLMFNEHVTDIAAAAGESWLSYRNRYTRAWPGSLHALEGFARVATTGGTVTVEDGKRLAVAGATRVLILLDVRLLYDAERSESDAARRALEALPADYDALLATHAARHGELFDRMQLELGGGQDHAGTTEELLEASTYEEPNRALLEKEFDAGRYNIISSTGEWPPALQGVWGGTYVPDWAGDFTHNGNVPSAIAANLMGNMPELMLAYTAYLEWLVPWLEINAAHIFGARGVVLPSRTSTHGYNNALAPNFAGGMWVAGAGWAARFFYDYYLYTGDRDFLATRALPFMEKAVVFFEDYLYEGPEGTYVFSPCQSPENTPGNSDSQASFNATMDVAVAKELLRNTLAASRTLNRNSDKLALWDAMLTKMPDYMIDANGCVKEWLTPRLENNDDHRHASQLYPLFYGLPGEIAERPELRAAFRRSIAYKLEKHWGHNARGYMSFGLVQLGQAAASLGEGELAYECIRHLVNRFWLGNLASMHNHRSLLNMDISGGMPAVIIMMLVASEPGRIRLLPALPAAWPSGAIEGVLCRGNIEIRRLEWTPTQAVVTLIARRDAQEVTLVLDGETTLLALPVGRPVTTTLTR